MFQVVFHGIVTLVVLVVAAILTAGYVDTCNNLHEEVRYVGYNVGFLMYSSVFAGHGC